MVQHLSADASIHIIRPGDEIFRVLRDHYGEGAFLEDKQKLVDAFQRNNKHIVNVDQIYPGQCIVLPDMAPEKKELPLMGPEAQRRSSDFIEALGGTSSISQAVMSDISASLPLKLGMDSAGGVLGSFERAAARAIEDTKDLKRLWESQRSGDIKRSFYNTERVKVIHRMDSNLGGFRPHAFAERPSPKMAPSRELMRFSTSGKGPTAQMTRSIRNLNKAVGRLKIQGGILIFAQVGTAGYDLSQADTEREKTGIIVETGGSILGSIAAGALVTLAVGTPAGWLGLAGVAIAGMVGGTGVGMVSRHLNDRHLYDEDGEAKFDILKRIWG